MDALNELNTKLMSSLSKLRENSLQAINIQSKRDLAEYKEQIRRIEFAHEHKLVPRYEEWPKSYQMLYKLTY